MSQRRQRRIRIGIVMMAVGLAFFLQARFDFLSSEYLLLLLGAGFLAGYLWQRRYGLMVPAGVLMGLGCGRVLDRLPVGDIEGDQLGLGLGFVAVFVVPLLIEGKARWWPLIPGGVLILSAFDATGDLTGYLFRNWPLVLLIVGALLVLAGWLDKGQSRSGLD